MNEAQLVSTFLGLTILFLPLLWSWVLGALRVWDLDAQMNPMIRQRWLYILRCLPLLKVSFLITIAYLPLFLSLGSYNYFQKGFIIFWLMLLGLIIFFIFYIWSTINRMYM